jgi:hypothetical protein
MYIVEIFDKTPGMEGKSEIGPFFSLQEAQTAAQKELVEIERTMEKPEFVQVFVRGA